MKRFFPFVLLSCVIASAFPREDSSNPLLSPREKRMVPIDIETWH